MIKVQPARSRLEKSESADRILLTRPPRGLAGRGGAVLLVSLLWLALVAALVAESLRRGNGEFAILIAVFALPGVLGVLAGLGYALKSWSLERDGSWLTLRHSGLFGSTMRRWPSEDVGSFYVRDAVPGSDLTVRSRLVVGFRNGRSEDLIFDDDEEDLTWTGAMLADPRGARRAASPLVLAAEPERRKVDPEIVPTTLSCRTFEGGTEVFFMPLIRAKGRWWRLPLAALLGAIVLIGVAVVLHQATGGGVAATIPRFLLAALLGGTCWRIWVLQRWALVQILDGKITVKESRGKPLLLDVTEVEFVQTFRIGRHTELQLLLRNNQPKVRILAGRPGPELEWAARFLRVAIKGRTAIPENAPLKVDPSAGGCPVCLEKMESRAVFCSKCRTPAHEECWSYMGMCSTYGCREIRFDRA